MTVNQRFRESARRALEAAVAASLVLHIAAFVLVPRPEQPEPPPRAPQVQPMEIVRIPHYIEPTPPAEISRPALTGGDFREAVFPVEAPEPPAAVNDASSAAPAAAPAAGAAFEVFDRLPELRGSAPVEYPEMARTLGIEGEILLEVTVGRQGRVVDVRVVEFTSELFTAAAVAAAREWTFRPAEQSGRPVRATVLVPLRFELRD